MRLQSPRVLRVEPEDEYVLRLWFTNGEERVFDLSPYLGIGVFRELKDTAAFRDVRASMGAVSWKGGQDLSADTLYLESVPASTVLVAREKQKRYRTERQARPRAQRRGLKPK